MIHGTVTPQEELPKILILGMADSIHVARWIAQHIGGGFDVVLFPSGPNRRLHPLVEVMAAESQKSAHGALEVAQPLLHRLGVFFYAIDLILGNRLRGRLLRAEMASREFSAIHVLELQHAGYLLLRVAQHLTGVPILVTNWGSDIFWFRRFPSHKKRLEELMRLADFYSCECHRDVELARDLGFSGHVLPVIPNAGGLEVPNFLDGRVRPSERTLILVKGYTAFVGRALRPLRALKAIRRNIEPFRVIVYSASRSARVYSWVLRRIHGMNVQSLASGVPHDEMLKLFAQARVYVGISLSDGISTSLLEAMSMGAFPIQTNTSCADEWLTERSGFIVDPDDRDDLRSKLLRAVYDDDLVDNAALINHRIIKERANHDEVARVAKSFYPIVLSHSSRGKSDQ